MHDDDTVDAVSVLVVVSCNFKLEHCGYQQQPECSSR